MSRRHRFVPMVCRYWPGKRSERCPGRRHFACDRQSSNDKCRSGSLIQRVPHHTARRRHTSISAASGLMTGCPQCSTPAQTEQSPENPERFSFYLKISRILHRVEHVTDDTVGFRDRLEPASGKRVSALHRIGARNRKSAPRRSGTWRRPSGSTEDRAPHAAQDRRCRTGKCAAAGKIPRVSRDRVEM